MELPTQSAMEKEAKDLAEDMTYPENQAQIYGFKKGAEWMEQQLEPIITEYGMNEIKLKEKIAELEPRWIDVNNSLPPFNQLVLFRGVIDWKTKDNVSYFSDEMTFEQEILEYGQSGYILKNNTDYMVVQYPAPNELCSEYITHWQYLIEPQDK